MVVMQVVSEKWSDSGYVLKSEPAGFVYGLDVGYESKCHTVISTVMYWSHRPTLVVCDGIT